MAQMNLTPEEINYINSIREKEAAELASKEAEAAAVKEAEENKDDLDEIIDQVLVEAKNNQMTLTERVSNIESIMPNILKIKSELDSMMQQFLLKQEEDVRANIERSQQNLKILKEIHQLRIHVDRLKPKIGILFWLASVAVGITASYLFPEIVPFVEKFFSLGKAI